MVVPGALIYTGPALFRLPWTCSGLQVPPFIIGMIKCGPLWSFAVFSHTPLRRFMSIALRYDTTCPTARTDTPTQRRNWKPYPRYGVGKITWKIRYVQIIKHYPVCCFVFRPEDRRQSRFRQQPSHLHAEPNSWVCFYATSVTSVCRSVCLSVCNISELWSQSATKSGHRRITG